VKGDPVSGVPGSFVNSQQSSRGGSMKRLLVVVSIFASAAFVSVSIASAQLSAIACSGDSKHPCPSQGSDFFAPTVKKKHAEPNLIAKSYCGEKWSKTGKQPGQAKGTVLGLSIPGGCCGYRLVRIDCYD
jgi:hypothetical protein